MRKKLLLLMLPLAVVFLFSAYKPIYADVSNELQIYQDIADSSAKEEIAKLRALGIIPAVEGEDNFKPISVLDKETLATWLAKAANAKGHTENPTPEEYAEEAVEARYIESLEGDATLADVVAGILKVIGVQDVEDPAEQAEELGILEGEWHDRVDGGEKATREDAALLFDMSLATKGPGGQSILDILGVVEGPTGTITDVTEKMATVDGEEKETITVTINDKALPFYLEGKIALFEDILAAKGKQAVLSYVKSIEEEGQPAQEMLVFLQGDAAAAGGTAATNEEDKEVEQTEPEEAVSATTMEEEDEKSESTAAESATWTIFISLLLIVGVIILLTGRKKV